MTELVPREDAPGSVDLVVDLAKLSISYYSHDSVLVGSDAGFSPDAGFGLLTDPATGISSKVRINVSSKPTDGVVRVSNSLQQQGFGPATHVQLSLVPTIRYESVKLQAAEAITQNQIFIPEEDFDALDKGYEYYRLYSPWTKCSIVFSLDEIKPFRLVEGDTPGVKLSRYQRMLLRLHVPLERPRAFLEYCEGKWGALDQALSDKIDSCYEGGMRDPGMGFNEERQLFGELAKRGFSDLLLVPEISSTREEESSSRAIRGKLRAGVRVTADFAFGARSSTMRVVRPYEIDETRSIVRLSADSMTMLGVEDTDKVIISHCGRQASARVLSIDNEDGIRQNSAMGEFETVDIVVGVPASVRKELGVASIDTCVEIRRDTEFLMVKNLNMQLISAIAWVFTVVQVAPALGISLGASILVYLAVLPLVWYVSLAGERGKVR